MSLLRKVFREFEEDPFFDPSGIQEGSSVRNCLKARELAVRIISDEGKVVGLAEVMRELAVFSLGPERHGDVFSDQHMVRVLYWLHEDEELRGRLERFAEPVSNLRAEHYIQLTLGIEHVNATETKRAVLAAWLTYLRQNVGSCFATAPAIVIQREQPHQFLKDMEELIGTGRLRRVFGGVEYAVPFSPNWGYGDLQKPFVVNRQAAHSPGLQEALGKRELVRALKAQHEPFARPIELIEEEGAREQFKLRTVCPLLKAWEYTLASFAEAKTAFAKWNLYASLGFNPDEPGGLGEILRRFLQERLDEANRAAEDAQNRYEGAYYQATHTEGRLRRAPPSETAWLRMELKRRVDEMNGLQAERDEEQRRASRLGGSLGFLIEQYTHLFPAYFQEIYDAEMVLKAASIFDDSPAGFRLLYKHGRENSSQWTLIYTAEEFVDSLVSFFLATEGMVGGEPQMEGMAHDLSDLISMIVHHVRSDFFLETALQRMAQLHGTTLPKRPLKNLDRVEKKPWAYVSGGGMKELVSCYYSRDDLTYSDRNIENASDLCVFLLDRLKELPASTTDPFLHDADRSMLMQSPTHGFILKPGLPFFREGWLDRGNTSTWVRDAIVRPQEEKMDAYRITPEMVKWLGLPPSKTRLRLRDFRRISPWPPDEIDGFIYKTFPLMPGSQIRKTLYLVFEDLGEGGLEAFDKQMKHYPPFMTAREFFDLCLALLMLERRSTTSETNLPLKLRQTLEAQDLLLPAPVIFADTNWTGSYFGFLVNPGTLELEVWRTDPLGLDAAPMHDWFQNSLNKPWGVYTNPMEYSSH